MRTWTALSVILIFIFALALIAWGLFSQTFFAGGVAAGEFGWHVFAFSSGLFLLGSPAILSFTLAIIPLALKRKLGNAVALAFAFSVGVILVLCLSGFFAGLMGSIAYNEFALSTRSFADWGLAILGGFAYVLALGEIDIIHVTRRALPEKIARIIVRDSGIYGAFMLGIFVSLVNMHPVTWVLLADALQKGDPMLGAGLLLIHAVGQVIPLLIVLTLATLQVNASAWIAERKERARVLLAWLLIGVAGVLINMGLGYFLSLFGVSGGILRVFTYKWFLAALWLIPLWVIYFKESRRVYGGPLGEWKRIQHVIARAEQERRTLLLSLHFPLSANADHLKKLEQRIDVLEKQQQVLESGIRHAVEEGLRSGSTQQLEERLLMMRFAFSLVTSLLIVSVLSVFTV